MKVQVAGMRTRHGTRDAGCVLRCLIVDDSRLFQDAARRLLALGEIVVVGVAETGEQAVQQVNALEPDVTLLDVDLGKASGFDVARRLEREAGHRSGAVILVSTHPEADYADLIAASPVLGFLPKATLSATAIRGLLDNNRA